MPATKRSLWSEQLLEIAREIEDVAGWLKDSALEDFGIQWKAEAYLALGYFTEAKQYCQRSYETCIVLGNLEVTFTQLSLCAQKYA